LHPLAKAAFAVSFNLAPSMIFHRISPFPQLRSGRAKLPSDSPHPGKDNIQFCSASKTAEEFYQSAGFCHQKFPLKLKKIFMRFLLLHRGNNHI